MSKSKLKRLTDLFCEGEILVVPDRDGHEVPLWVNKLTSFEMEQANHEGRIARARTMMAIREVGTPEAQLFEQTLGDLTDRDVIDALVGDKGNEFVVKAIQDMRSEEDWKERLEVLEWSTDQVAGKSDDDPDVRLIRKVMDEYEAEITARVDRASADLKLELSELGGDQLRERYRDSYIEQRGLNAFSVEKEKNQIFFALRECDATRQGENWQHAACDHTGRWLDEPAEVEQLPAGLLDRVRTAYQALSVAPDTARFSDALASSSASSEPSSKQGDSEASGPAETPSEPAGSSSSP